MKHLIKANLKTFAGSDKRLYGIIVLKDFMCQRNKGHEREKGNVYVEFTDICMIQNIGNKLKKTIWKKKYNLLAKEMVGLVFMICTCCKRGGTQPGKVMEKVAPRVAKLSRLSHSQEGYRFKPFFSETLFPILQTSQSAHLAIPDKTQKVFMGK